MPNPLKEPLAISESTDLLDNKIDRGLSRFLVIGADVRRMRRPELSNILCLDDDNEDCRNDYSAKQHEEQN